MAEAQKQPFAVFDIDGTLIRWQLYHAIADELAKANLIDAETFNGIRSARMQWKRREHAQAFKDYEMQLVMAYDKLLRSISPNQLEKAADAVFEEYKDQTYTYTRQLITDLKAKNYLLFAISGSQQEVIAQIAQHYGFDDFIGSHFVRKNGRFTGEKISPVFDKEAALKTLVERHGLSYGGSIGIGDSHSDIALLTSVEQPIAFNPEDRLFAYARQHGWDIIVERKNVIYELKADDGKYILA
ncbi:MAG TPA: HAD-IB family hydrolase [Candidatus Saccharimonadales bacterium]|nr:HAD-IB family hydrolase [Candidatus Saccharimonadales bacterium]